MLTFKTSLKETRCLGNSYLLTYFFIDCLKIQFLIDSLPLHFFFSTQLVSPPLVTYPSLCSTCVTYRTPCHGIGHQLLPNLPYYSKCYGFERAFFTFRCFLPCTTLLCCFQGFPGSQQFNLKVSRASC